MARAIVRDCCDSSVSARVYALIAITIGVAPVIAPFSGALYLSIGTWRGLFVGLALLGAMLGVYVFMKFMETRPSEVMHQARSESWYAGYWALLKNKTLMQCLLGYGLGTSALFVYIATVPDLMMTGFNLTPVQFGWFFAVNILGNVGASAISTRLLRHYTPDVIARHGNRLGLFAAACLVVAGLTGFGQLWGVAIPLFFVMTSLGFTQPNMGAIAMAVDPSRSGAAASLLGALQFSLCAAITAVVSLLHDGSARPMALAIFLCLSGAWCFYNVITRASRVNCSA
jgi:DHA1 family bicyclomycin/chloramphenicol resistance-like MFS transporter